MHVIDIENQTNELKCSLKDHDNYGGGGIILFSDPSVVVFAAQTRIQLTFKSGPVQTNATRSFQVNYSTTGKVLKEKH